MIETKSQIWYLCGTNAQMINWLVELDAVVFE